MSSCTMIFICQRNIAETIIMAPTEYRCDSAETIIMAPTVYRLM